MLGDRSDDGLMCPSTIDRSEAIGPSWESAGNISRENTSNIRQVETLVVMMVNKRSKERRQRHTLKKTKSSVLVGVVEVRLGIGSTTM